MRVKALWPKLVDIIGDGENNPEKLKETWKRAKIKKKGNENI